MSYDQLEELDRWALLRLGELIARVRRAYDEYQFHAVFHAAHNFCAVDLSALYLDIIKDRLYVSAPDDPRRRAAQTRVLRDADRAAAAAGAVLTFTAEEVWAHIPGRGKPESVHLVTFPEERGEWLDERLGAEWERLLEVRGEVSRALEAARKAGKIGKSVDAVVYVPSAPEEEWRPAARRQGRGPARDALERLGRAARRARGRRRRRRPTRARTSPGSPSRCCPPRRSAGRSASAAGSGARASARTRSIPPSASAARPVIRALRP